MRLKCRYCGKPFEDSRSTVVLAAYGAHRRTCGPPPRRGRPIPVAGKPAARGKYAATPDLIERVRMEGCLAYIDGEDQVENPYEGQAVNKAWLEGWLVAEMAHKEGM